MLARQTRGRDATAEKKRMVKRESANREGKKTLLLMYENKSFLFVSFSDRFFRSPKQRRIHYMDVNQNDKKMLWKKCV